MWHHAVFCFLFLEVKMFPLKTLRSRHEDVSAGSGLLQFLEL